MTGRAVSLDILHGDIKDVDADLLVLKNMENADGAGREVARAMGLGPYTWDGLPATGQERIFDRRLRDSKVEAQYALYIGVQPAPYFRYQDIREFSRRALGSAGRDLEGIEHITFTLHGPGYGLDEKEAVESEIAGIIDAVQQGVAPTELSRVSIVERNHERANRLNKYLDEFHPSRTIEPDKSTPRGTRSVGYDSETKPQIFVAMPFSESFEDVYHLAITDAAHSIDFLCERIDEDSFTGNITEQIKSNIESASLVIADMTNANPNVYLEVGYAWAKDIPTLLLTQNTDDLKFDVQNHNTMRYDRDNLHKLRENLEEELNGLKEDNLDA
jgi:hypothetical protein